MNVSSFWAWLDVNCYKKRKEYIQTLKLVYEILRDKEKLNTAIKSIEQQLSEYKEETLSFSNQARYNHGKLAFEVVSLAFGAGEVKALLKGEKTIAEIFSKIGKLSKEAIAEIKKIKVPKSADAIRIAERIKGIGKLGNYTIKSVTGDIRKFSQYALTNPSKKRLVCR